MPTEAVLRIFRADWNSELASGQIDLDGEDPAALVQLGEALVRLFMERFTEPLPATVEERFELPLLDSRTGEELSVRLVGYTDFTLPGTVGELKTTTRKTDPSQWSLQLAAYAWAYESLKGVRPSVRVIELVKTKVPKIEVHDLVVDAASIAWFLEVACEALAGIEAGAFFPNPSWICASCEYRKACRGA